MEHRIYTSLSQNDRFISKIACRFKLEITFDEDSCKWEVSIKESGTVLRDVVFESSSYHEAEIYYQTALNNIWKCKDYYQRRQTIKLDPREKFTICEFVGKDFEPVR